MLAEHLDSLPTLRLAPGQSLCGEGNTVLRFARAADGVQITADSTVSGLSIIADPDRRAVFNDTTFAGFGRIELRELHVTGCVRILAEQEASGGHVIVTDVHVEEADARGYDARPSGYGVEVIPGAFMLWNRQSDPGSLITADLAGIAAGSPGKPVRGSGVFVAGTPGGGRTVATRLETGEVHSDGGIAPGTPDRISGGVFVVSGSVGRRRQEPRAGHDIRPQRHGAGQLGQRRHVASRR